MLATIVENDPDITGTVFPETNTRSEHTAMRDDLHWSSDGKAIAAIDAARIKEFHSKE